MLQGKPGIDSSYSEVTAQLAEEAKALLGEYPVLWGRYFATSGVVEYQCSEENKPLAQLGIRLLPIARRTKDVGGSEAEGATDAQACVGDILATFTADYLAAHGGEFLVFLDVEGDPPLSEPYYSGWAKSLVQESRARTADRVSLLPCIYAPQGNKPTWKALAQAAGSGVPCHGAWVARYPGEKGHGSMPGWEVEYLAPEIELPCEILLWQYAGNALEGKIDCSQTNPHIDLEGALLSRLILPPD